ncbi:uncharacterized protein LOC128745240 [Sabethes cyaneus]|uniref:uncharacterized protein LOC128745240 n=1 Tax=Sabethes cyaneus TaxID=53552 RepID=UPI00237E0F93|nr:uncharacterized protein LOC128745240 [Sabethes cyaneus]
MFWILRRTGAANFFNSINNNYTAKGGSSASGSADKHAPRPPRRAYGRLSVESDDAQSLRRDTELNDNLIDVDGELSVSNSINNNNNNNNVLVKNQNKATPGGVGGGNGKADGGGSRYGSNAGAATTTTMATGKINGCSSHLFASPDGRYGPATDDDDVNRNQSNCYETDSDLELDATIKEQRLEEQAISRLQAMALSDDDEYDESLTCNVCDRAFHCHRQLASHQQKKRHFGCSGCDSLFPSLMLLEHHKEEFEHWSDFEDDGRLPCCRRNRRDDDYTDTETGTSDAESEDLERLL